MAQASGPRAHLVVGGFPTGSLAGHDMDFARHRILGLLQEVPSVRTSTANDYTEIERWLEGSDLLITYTAGPFANEAQAENIERWLEDGGRWLALHGSCGGKAARFQTDDGPRKRMVKARHHQAIGGFFLNHPPIRRFSVDVAAPDHRLTAGLPASFEVIDELYLVELQHPESTTILLTTDLPEDPSPPGFGFVYDEDTSLLADGRTRVLGYEHRRGRGAVAYFGLGHCHHPQSNTQPLVDASVSGDASVPNPFRGAWDGEALPTLIRNAIAWGIGR